MRKSGGLLIVGLRNRVKHLLVQGIHIDEKLQY